MVEIKFINRKSFTTTNTVRSAATITVLVLCLSAARGENLTTLDGKTYTNVVYVANYSTVVIITHNGGESGIRPANLPEDFRAKYGIIIETDAPKVPVTQSQTNQVNFSQQAGSATSQPILQSTNPVDIFLANHQDSSLEVERQDWVQIPGVEAQQALFK